MGHFYLLGAIQQVIFGWNNASFIVRRERDANKEKDVLQMAERELSMKLDVSEALIGLKAVQREAKEAVRALKEVEGARSKTNLQVGEIVQYNDGINWFPALVLRLMTDGMLNLMIFTDYPDGKPPQILRNVIKGPNKGQWRYKNAS